MLNFTENSTDCSWIIREQFGRQWTRELLHFPLCWEPGEQQSRNLVVADPEGPLPSQLCAVSYHLDGSLAAATIWCLVDLSPFKTLELHLENAIDSSKPLCWRQDNDYTVAANDIITVRVPLSGCYPAACAPGPVLAISGAETGWLGQGKVLAQKPLTVAVVMREQGPLLLRWEYTAHYERRNLITVECTLFIDANFVHLREVSSYDSDLVFTFDAFPGLAPDQLLHHGGGEANWLALQECDYARREELCHVDFNSGHQHMSKAWFGLFQKDTEPLLGVVEMQGHTWTNTSVNRLHLLANPPESLLITSPWQGGTKSWALVCSTATPNLKMADSRECIELSRIHQKYSEVPLQKMKEWVLEWEENGTMRPFLQCDVEGITRARAKVQASFELTRAYQALAVAAEQNMVAGNMASTMATLWVALGEDAYGWNAVRMLEAEIDQSIATIWQEGALLRLIIFHGRVMKLWLPAYDVLSAGGFINAELDRKLHRHFAFLAYGMADPETFPKQYNLRDLNDPDAFFQGLGAEIGDAMCPPNFHTEYFTTYGIMGCCFPGHPMAQSWRDEALAMTERMLEVHFYDSGAYSESPNYHSHAFLMLNQFALAMRRYGVDLFQHPRIKAQYDYFIRMQTPPILLNEAAQRFIQPWTLLDSERERYAMLPGNGNTGSDCSDMPLPMELAIGALIYRESDQELSARCMTTWRRGGRFIHNINNDLTFLLVANLDLPGGESLNLSSDLLTGAYATFRGNPESDDEVFVLTKNGTATHHNDFDEGGFTIWAYGAPVASDYGYVACHEGQHQGVSDTWKHNCVEFDGKSNGYLGIEQTRPPEQWISTDLADLLISDLSCTNFRDLAQMSYLDRIATEKIEYRRYTLFVKPHYLLVFDSILACPTTHRWWLHAQAKDIFIDGPRARFTGKFGVDLLAHFITPIAPNIETGEWGVMKHIFATQVKAKDWRVIVAPAKPGQDFTITHCHAGRVVTVETSNYHDQLFLAHYPFHYEDDGVVFAGTAGVIRRYKAQDIIQCRLLEGTELRVKWE